MHARMGAESGRERGGGRLEEPYDGHTVVRAGGARRGNKAKKFKKTHALILT